MNVYFFTPYGFDGNLGKAYNHYCSLVKDPKDWICMIDGDVMMLPKDWGHHLKDLIKAYPDTGLFTCLTNRVACTGQCYNKEISDVSDLKYHRELALKLQQEHRLDFEQLTHPISGHLMMFRKGVWKLVNGFSETIDPQYAYKIKRNIAGVDNDFSERVLKAGFDIKLATGFYVCHYYRMIEGIDWKEHVR